MQTALYQLAEDFLSTIVFLIAYFATGNLYLAVILAIMVGVGQFVLLKRRGRTLDAMGWLSLGFAIALGGATLITDDSRFMIHFAIAVVMLRPGWLKRYMPDVVRENVPERVLVASGYAWAALMIVLGLANLVIASRYSIEVWAWFISLGAVGAKVVAFLIQFALIQILVRRKLRLNAAAAKSTAAPLAP
jgi:intracellular septation protein